MSNVEVKEQYAQLRERAETAEKARDIALADAARWQEACEKSCDREGRSAEESRTLRDKLDRTLRELKKLRSKATPPEGPLGVLIENYAFLRPNTQALVDWAHSLVPRRNSRRNAAVDAMRRGFSAGKSEAEIAGDMMIAANVYDIGDADEESLRNAAAEVLRRELGLDKYDDDIAGEMLKAAGVVDPDEEIPE